MSIFDTISAPIKTATKSAFDLISKPIKAVEKFIEAPDNSASGVLKNTVLGLPKAAKDVAVDVAQSIPRSLASVGLTAMGKKELTPDGSKTFNFLYGDKPVKSIPERSKDATATLESMGFSKGFSKTLAPFGVIGSTALDLYPGTSGEGAIIKTLAKEGTEQGVKAFLKQNVKNLSDEVIERLAPQIAKTGDEKAIKEFLDQGIEESKTAVQRLTESIKKAKPITKDIQAAQSAERSKRFGEASAAQSAEGGQAGYFAGLQRLKGALVDNANFSFEGVGGKLDKGTIDDLFLQVQRHPTLNFGEQLSAQSGLQKLLEGTAPQPKQLQLLEEVFGSDLIRAIREKRPLSEKAKETIVNILNIPRSLKTTLDMSAPLRQGAFLIPTHPVSSGEAFSGMIKDFFSESSFNKYLDDLYKSPDYRRIKDSGLYVADPRKIAGGITSREENFLSNIVENVPYLGAPAKASSRAYSSFLNRQRINVFNDLANQFKVDGFDSPENLEALAKFVNTATGRGSMGQLERATQTLSGLLFSPRFNASRISLLNPMSYVNQPAPVRKEAIKSMAAFTGTVISILSLLKAAGASVELNPTSSDFGQARFGKTRYDLTAGFRPWIVYLSRMLTGKTKSATTGTVRDISNPDFGGQNRLDVTTNFIRSKLAPVPSVVADLMAGSNVVGDPVTAKSLFQNNFIPLVTQDVTDAVKNDGIQALFTVGLPAFFGAGVSTFDAPSTKKGNIKLPATLPSKLPKLDGKKLPKLPKLPEIK